MKKRKFTEYISLRYPCWKLITNLPHPANMGAEFFIYQKSDEKKDDSHKEWNLVAVRLTQLKYRVIVPNWHSCQPCQKFAQQLLPELLKWAGGTKFALLLGTSWGGGIAAKFAAAHPDMVG